MNECILVVDDDPEIVRAIAITLEREGYQVCRAYDGMEALDQALDSDKILGRSRGADDDVTTPYNPQERAARVKSQLRR